MKWKLMEIIETTGATPSTLPEGHLTLKGISTDSRTIRDGELFVALKGPRYDGHQFIKVALSKGAAAILAQDPTTITDEVPHLFVPDTLSAYGNIAKSYRKKLKAKIIAITGSMGKTSTKDMAFSILSRKYKATKTDKNENNRVGVPKTLLSISPDTDIAVIELGSNIPGEIALLTEIVRPDRALITNIAPVHLEQFVSLEGVRVEKSSLFWRTPSNTLRFINKDDPEIQKIPGIPGWPTTSFATEGKADVEASHIEPLGLKGTRFTLFTNGEGVEITLPLIGIHQVRNAVAAATLGIAEGISLSHIKDALESYRPASGRLEPIYTKSECIILNDTYNANPVATAMAIKTLAMFNRSHITIAILGDMLELGEKAEIYHKEIGAECAKNDIKLLCITGAYSEFIRKGAIEKGLDKKRAFTFKDKVQLLKHLATYLKEKSMILIKGSNALNMERWVKVIQTHIDKQGGHA